MKNGNILAILVLASVAGFLLFRYINRPASISPPDPPVTGTSTGTKQPPEETNL